MKDCSAAPSACTWHVGEKYYPTVGIVFHPGSVWLEAVISHQDLSSYLVFLMYIDWCTDIAHPGEMGWRFHSHSNTTVWCKNWGETTVRAGRCFTLVFLYCLWNLSTAMAQPLGCLGKVFAVCMETGLINTRNSVMLFSWSVLFSDVRNILFFL